MHERQVHLTKCTAELAWAWSQTDLLIAEEVLTECGFSQGEKGVWAMLE